MMKIAYESNDEFYIDDYMKVKVSKKLREDMKTGTYLYEQNEGMKLKIVRKRINRDSKVKIIKNI